MASFLGGTLYPFSNPSQIALKRTAAIRKVLLISISCERGLLFDDFSAPRPGEYGFAQRATRNERWWMFFGRETNGGPTPQDRIRPSTRHRPSQTTRSINGRRGGFAATDSRISQAGPHDHRLVSISIFSQTLAEENHLNAPSPEQVREQDWHIWSGAERLEHLGISALAWLAVAVFGGWCFERLVGDVVKLIASLRL